MIIRRSTSTLRASIIRICEDVCEVDELEMAKTEKGAEFNSAPFSGV